jgi:hypothetical protein
MAFDPTPTSWIPGITLALSALGATPVESFQLIDESGSIWNISIETDGTLKQTKVEPPEE